MYKLFILLLLSFYSPLIFAQVDPAIDWKVLDEDHAVWIYDSRHKSLVEQYSRNFKRLYPHLQEMFKEVPEKTTFVISDYTDLPNGSATVFPYPLVTIYPVIPIPSSPIGESDDSFYEILAHEYTHILNLYPVHGIPRAFSWIFGSIVRPNGFLPRWYAEGLAVFTESYFTPKGGRLRSQNFEGLMRALGTTQAWPQFSIDQLNDFQPDWIGGRRAYLLGGALMHDLATEHGLETIYHLNQRYSRRVPYFIEAPVEEKTGLDFAGLLNETYTKIQARVDEQMKTIRSAPISEGSLLLGQGNHNHLPRFSPDGKYLAYLSRDHNVPSAVHLITRDSKTPLKDSKPVRIAFGTEIEHLSWSSDSKKLAYNNAENFKRFYIFSDISIYDVTTQKTLKVTSGARAGDMAFVNGDKDLVFVQNIAGSKQIAMVNIATKTVKTLYTPPRLGTNLYSVIMQDNKILFIEQYAEKRNLKSLDLAAMKVTTLNENIATTRLQKTHRGIIITSSDSGVDNLYLTPQLNDTSDIKKSRVLTNSLTRVFDGDLDPLDNSLLFAEQKEKGVFIYAQSEKEWNRIDRAPAVTPLLTIPTPRKLEVAVDDSSRGTEKEFSSWPYMLPRYWMPFGYVLDGGMGFQGTTGGVDPLGKNAYSLQVEWDTLTKKTGAAFEYSNTSTPVQLSFDAAQVYRYFYSNDTVIQDTSVGMGGNFIVPFMWRTWTAGLGWRQSNTDLGVREFRRSGPTAHLSYNSAVRRGYQVSPQSGTGFSVMHQSVIEDLGNIGYEKTNLSFRQFFPSFFENHALMFQVNGTYAPELENKSSIFYTSSIGGNFFTNQLVPPFLVRGYPSGYLIGYNMAAATLEYRFPIAQVFKGWDTIPLFLRQIRGAFIGDVVGLDGFRYNVGTDTFLRSRFGDSWYGGYGAEVDFELTAGYYLPITLSFGVYRGADRTVAPDDLSYFFMFRF